MWWADPTLEKSQPAPCTLHKAPQGSELKVIRCGRSQRWGSSWGLRERKLYRWALPFSYALTSTPTSEPRHSLESSSLKRLEEIKIASFYSRCWQMRIKLPHFCMGVRVGHITWKVLDWVLSTCKAQNKQTEKLTLNIKWQNVRHKNKVKKKNLIIYTDLRRYYSLKRHQNVMKREYSEYNKEKSYSWNKKNFT